MEKSGSQLVADALLAHEVTDFFGLVGGPISGAIGTSIEAGIRCVDVRDEPAAAFAAVAYSRLRQTPAIVMTCSGPGTTNAVTGVAHTYVDGAPVIVLGGSTAQYQRGIGAFQDIDQVSLFRPITKWSFQVTDTAEVPAAIARAFQVATTGAPGPVYLDLPSDVLYSTIDVAEVPQATARPQVRLGANPAAITAAAAALTEAERPIVVAGSGVLWSRAWTEPAALVDATGIPFYTTPMASGLLPETHARSFPAARSTAFRETDCVLLVGTRDNYVLNFLEPPVFAGIPGVVSINADAAEIGRNHPVDVAIAADAGLALAALTAELAASSPLGATDAWAARLAEVNRAGRERSLTDAASDEVPIHPLRLATEVEQAIPAEAIRVLDGNDTLAFGRRAFAAALPGGLLNPGPFGTMGVGVPFALGAKVARPDLPVVLLIGDGAFGYHAIELDTAVRHGIGFVCVIANNAGWTAHRDTAGYGLEYSRYDELSKVVGCFGVNVTDPAELKSALADAIAYAAAESKPAVVNVTMASIAAGGRSFTRHARGKDASYAAV